MARRLQFSVSLGVVMEDEISFEEVEVLGGNNFLVSAIMVLKKQRRDLEMELHGLRERVRLLENQNAAFLNVSADRLLEKTV
jgi:hypothetical protein